MPKNNIDPQKTLKFLFEQGLDSSNPLKCVPQYLPERPSGRVFVIAAGKAAASMARAVEIAWGSDIKGIAVTRYAHVMECESIEVVEAAHPVPDDRGEVAARRLLGEAGQLGEGDLLLCLISGGGSALLGLPADDLTSQDKRDINKALLRSGAPIGEMNIVRKHLSAIKGGRLAKVAYPASVLTLAISDVPGDDISVIASGPSVPDESTRFDAVEILKKYNIDVSDRVTNHLNSELSETPKPGDKVFKTCNFELAARPKDMVDHVAKAAETSGFSVMNLGADIEGEAKEIGIEHAKLAIKTWNNMAPGDQPIAIISGGETTVTVTGAKSHVGRGGRNCEYILALANGLNGAEGIFALACDTDGIDGSEDNAGAIISPTTLSRARELNISAQDMLEAHDSYSFFAVLGDLVKTGPTLTNVNDLRVLLLFR